MTEALRTAIKNKNKMHTNALKNNDKKLFDEYKIIKNRLTSLLHNTEIQYYSNQLDIHRNDSAKTWKVLKNIIGKERNHSNNKLSFCIDNIMVTESADIANGFNDFFVSIGPQLADKISCTVNPVSYLVSIENSIVFPEISCAEVKYIIQSLKNSSAGWDEIPTFVAKKMC